MLNVYEFFFLSCLHLFSIFFLFIFLFVFFFFCHLKMKPETFLDNFVFGYRSVVIIIWWWRILFLLNDVLKCMNVIRSYCGSHRLEQELPKNLSHHRSPKKKLCSICLCDVTSFASCDSLFVPCCQKSWFHRVCIQVGTVLRRLIHWCLSHEYMFVICHLFFIFECCILSGENWDQRLDRWTSH